MNLTTQPIENETDAHAPALTPKAAPSACVARGTSAASSLRAPRRSTLARSAVALAAVAGLWAGPASANSSGFKSYYYSVTIGPASDFSIYNGEAQTSWYSLADAPQWFMVADGGVVTTTNNLIATFTADPGWVFKSVDVMLAGESVYVYDGTATLNLNTTVSSNSTGVTDAAASWQNPWWFQGATAVVNLYQPTFALNDTTFQLDVTAFFRYEGHGALGHPELRADVGMVPAPVPEPGTAALLISGIGGLGLLLRRRTARAI